LEAGEKQDVDIAGIEESPPADLELAMEHCGQDRDLLDVVIKAFFDQAPRLLQSLREATDAGDWATIARLAHNLKGSGATLGASQVPSTAIEIERAADNHDRNLAAALAELLETQITSLRDFLANLPG
jgi:HPt (histidine-containing phosphotransfer) domain-containing protein